VAERAPTQRARPRCNSRSDLTGLCLRRCRCYPNQRLRVESRRKQPSPRRSGQCQDLPLEVEERRLEDLGERLLPQLPRRWIFARRRLEREVEAGRLALGVLRMAMQRQRVGRRIFPSRHAGMEPWGKEAEWMQEARAAAPAAGTLLFRRVRRHGSGRFPSCGRRGQAGPARRRLRRRATRGSIRGTMAGVRVRRAGARPRRLEASRARQRRDMRDSRRGGRASARAHAAAVRAQQRR
jgi:hypothetical protein